MYSVPGQPILLHDGVEVDVTGVEKGRGELSHQKTGDEVCGMEGRLPGDEDAPGVMVVVTLKDGVTEEGRDGEVPQGNGGHGMEVGESVAREQLRVTPYVVTQGDQGQGDQEEQTVLPYMEVLPCEQ